MYKKERRAKQHVIARSTEERRAKQHVIARSTEERRAKQHVIARSPEGTTKQSTNAQDYLDGSPRSLCSLAMTRLLVMCCCIGLLSGCSFKKKDGPPPYHVDASRIHNAVPRPEPLSKYGNMPFYNVFGKRYYTLRSSKHYSKIGVASWYGIKFHERHTSSGEPYNMLAMTAAHKTLPLPTYVEVTNLRNHRTIIVKVNDRGPFESNRIIDLSYVAAIKLGMIGHGTALVSVKAIDPYTGKPYAPAIKHQSIYLQVATFETRESAVKLKERLTSLTQAPVLVTPLAQKYQVRIGPLHNMTLARSLHQKLRRLHVAAHPTIRMMS